jgi:hypothetical protein
MEEIVFVDSGAWFATYVPTDPHHQAAAQFLASGALRLVTSDYILDETLTLFRARGQARRSLAVSAAILDEQLCRVLWVDKGDVLEAHSVYQRFADKAWSFTDCVSFAQMQRWGISKAFTFDDHFRQFGFVSVLP